MTRLMDILRAMRVNQWTKNLVVLAAFVFAFGDKTASISPYTLTRVAAAFVLFCLASSGIYLINDIRDLAADRLHPTKRFRPIAAGRVTVPTARGLAALLIALALTGSLWVSPLFAVVVPAYVLMQFVYTFWLKRIALVDVFIIALGFVLRALGGGVAIQVHISPWLLVCAFLLALFLALCKRRHEKLMVESSDDTRACLEEYDTKLLDQLIAIVSASTIVSYAIYTLTPDTVKKFGTSLLSTTIPFVMFGIFRYLDLVYRKEGGGRPEQTLLTDRVLIVDLALYGLTIMAIFAFLR